ncbi:3-dehydroshikimate dehydratase [Cryptococcus neoformans C23]|uniref:3-dehydroshikimate dehydratase n=1 Tax=Cryptococcus neoformans (strain H99 / ATCC 208821 / CBS 10515 / FGSC 9487) TaxID=235443 RepID=J9VX13_CRYN9|nr:3-dehydroshikimate dehydratase [Cryptococcus neoformans var. grubii H99]AUB29001.1 3-dehydroshikimate dehydratase [Cryptococcus neoformans var. grubii]OWZ38374.1 3-dehydroshikimate dehydratase [Cryptococcus neoformans var. grubii C23]OWZ74776.1 3-dehydroshikimate dehydratase [Cryptococcus neoformans var. grubii Bt85]OXG10470.1 3-dehydroshikimate dehydratase [Cryptococcus neoformans var. grubii Tu401-1]OXG30427.1 3-dehydroshikimate dehydratase [Cryptococcus neoformans var. grubii Bt15]OXG33|eukprot:XP_012053723.1 3-dehydroshikimate dehydratase [Cryptococcus neoformans var. grubii H99]
MSNDFSDLRFGVATASLGMNSIHDIYNKFGALQKAGFKYVEVGFGAYMEWVRSELPDLPPSTCPPEWSEADEPDPSDDAIWKALYAKTEDFKKLVAKYGMTCLVLQPLNQFDGWPEGSKRAEWVRRKAEKWLPLCSKLGVEQLQVGSNDYAEANAPDEKTAEDMRWLAELGAKQNPPVKIAYESWCFSKRVSDWEHTWKIVQLGDHPNLGLCIDTAHPPLAPAYGWDPTTGEGWTDEQYASFLERLRAVPKEKIFYVELSEVLKPVVPLGKGSPFDEWREKAQSPRGDGFVWAVCGRPVPLVGRDAGRGVKGPDDMGAARALETFKAVLSTGWRGICMFEFFEALHMEPADPEIPFKYADACALSSKRILEALKA